MPCYKLLCSLFICLLPGIIKAQVWPNGQKKLNYRIIGFSFPGKENAAEYELEIATGNYAQEAAFTQNIVKHTTSADNKIVAEVPFFGREYTWRVLYKNKSAVQEKSAFYHFSTGASALTDTSLNRLRIIKQAETYKVAYVFMDGYKVLYNMKGEAVWYLPDIDSVVNERCAPRDIAITPQGTITLLAADKAYEISYDGKVLWKAPNNIKTDGEQEQHYHHEFKRLSNGHYLVFGVEMIQLDYRRQMPVLPGGGVPAPAPQPGAPLIQQQVQCGVIIEYDEKGNIIWTYKTSEYLKGSDIVNRRFADGALNIKIHDNGFYFDEQAKVIYVSFRGLSRVIKIKYPEGTLLAEYGEKYKPGIRETGYNGLFCGQHNPRVSAKGYLYLFDNEQCHPDRYPKILMMKEQGKDMPEKVWEYECKIEGISPESGGGGSVEELPDGSILACAGSPFGKVFIVNMDKLELWSGMPETWMPAERTWKVLRMYRAEFVAASQLEHLIWENRK